MYSWSRKQEFIILIYYWVQFTIWVIKGPTLTNKKQNIKKGGKKTEVKVYVSDFSLLVNYQFALKFRHESLIEG